MARSAGRIWTVGAAVAALALAPAVGQAKTLALSELEFPATATVGQSGLTGSIVLARCRGGNSHACLGREISLTPSCSVEVAGRCQPAGAEPGVLAFSRATSGTCDTAFDVSAPDPVTGRIVLAPAIGNVLVPGSLDTCRIDLEFSVRRMPAGDADPGAPGVQTRQIATSAERDARTVSTMTIAPAPSIATLAAPGIVLGAGALTARAMVSGGGNPAGREVVFQLYGPGDASCERPIFVTFATLDDAGTATSAAYTPTRAGVYRWRVFLGGDLPASSACDDATAAVAVVAPAPPGATAGELGTATALVFGATPPGAAPPGSATTGSAAAGGDLEIVGWGFDRPPRVGQLVFLEVRARDPKRPISGVQVRFGEPRGLSGISACAPGTVASAGTERLRLPYTFRRSGRHAVTITALSGGCTATRTRATELLTVDVAPAAGARAGFAAAPARVRAAAASCAGSGEVPKDTAFHRNKVAAAVLCLVNAERKKRGLKKLARSKLLAQAARNHSKDMLKRRYFDHVGPRGPAFAARLRQVRYSGTSATENIGYGADFTAALIVRAWMNSPGHKANILGKMRFAGLGVAIDVPVSPRSPGATYTMVFGTKQR